MLIDKIEYQEHADELRWFIHDNKSLADFSSLDVAAREKIYPAAYELFHLGGVKLKELMCLEPSVLTEVCEHAYEISLMRLNGSSLKNNSLNCFLSLSDVIRAQIYPVAFDLFQLSFFKLKDLMCLEPSVLTEVCEYARQIYYITCYGGSLLKDFLKLSDAVRAQIYPAALELFGRWEFESRSYCLRELMCLEPAELTEVCRKALMKSPCHPSVIAIEAIIDKSITSSSSYIADSHLKSYNNGP